LISLDFDARRRFSYRIVAVVIHEGHVLLHRADFENFWSLPGGRAEILETSHTTLEREMQEELGVTVTVRRLLWVVENFFTFESRRFHELGLYYVVDLPPNSPYLYKTREYAGLEIDVAPLIFQWFPLEMLPNVKLMPSFLRTSLTRLPRSIEHVIHADPVDIQLGPSVSA
jgi:ADP-ribose pyrophosphatase YjhB (NUDIX family)